MSDMKEMLGQILERPGPPMASPDVMLTIARRAHRRRTAVGLAAVAVLAVMAAAVPFVNRPMEESASGVVTAPPHPVVHPVRNGAEMLDALAAALPPGSTIRRSASGDDVRIRDVGDVGTIRPGLGQDGVSTMSAAAIVYRGDRGGEFFLELIDYRQAADVSMRGRQPSGDLCAADVHPRAQQRTSCRTIMIGDTPIRYGTGKLYPNHPNTMCVFATRFIPGAVVTVYECMALVTFPRDRIGGLDAETFNPEQLAAFAASPALLG